MSEGGATRQGVGLRAEWMREGQRGAAEGEQHAGGAGREVHRQPQQLVAGEGDPVAVGRTPGRGRGRASGRPGSGRPARRTGRAARRTGSGPLSAGRAGRRPGRPGPVAEQVGQRDRDADRALVEIGQGPPALVRPAAIRRRWSCTVSGRGARRVRPGRAGRGLGCGRRRAGTGGRGRSGPWRRPALGWRAAGDLRHVAGKPLGAELDQRAGVAPGGAG